MYVKWKKGKMREDPEVQSIVKELTQKGFGYRDIKKKLKELYNCSYSDKHIREDMKKYRQYLIMYVFENLSADVNHPENYFVKNSDLVRARDIEKIKTQIIDAIRGLVQRESKWVKGVGSSKYSVDVYVSSGDINNTLKKLYNKTGIVYMCTVTPKEYRYFLQHLRNIMVGGKVKRDGGHEVVGPFNIDKECVKDIGSLLGTAKLVDGRVDAKYNGIIKNVEFVKNVMEVLLWGRRGIRT